MALRWPQGNRRSRLFPRLLLGLSAKMNLDGEAVANQHFISGLSLLSNRLHGIGRKSPVPVCFAGTRSTLQQRINPLLEFLERGLALDLLAVDEEGRRRVHLQHLTGIFLVGDELVEQG